MRTQTNAHAAKTKDGLWFSIEIERDEFLVFISSEALGCQSLQKENNPLAAYKANRQVIDAVARQKFLSGYPRPIKLGATDF